MFLFDLVDAFDKSKVNYALVGGYALALHGIVRATVDVDFVLTLSESQFQKAEDVLNGLNLKSRLPVSSKEIIKMRKEYINNRNLIAWGFVDYSDPARQVDILITKDYRDLKTQLISVGGRKIRVASLNSLLEMKKESGRPQDLIDIVRIKEKLNE